jgi:type III secretion HrpO family protein
MALTSLVHLAREALLLAVAISLPVLGVSALVGLVVSILQSSTQLQDSSIRQLPRFLAVVAVLVLSGPWMGSQLAEFAARVFSQV